MSSAMLGANATSTGLAHNMKLSVLISIWLLSLTHHGISVEGANLNDSTGWHKSLHRLRQLYVIFVESKTLNLCFVLLNYQLLSAIWNKYRLICGAVTECDYLSGVIFCVTCPAWGRGTPFPLFSSLVHLLPHLLLFSPFPFLIRFIYFSSFVHPFPFYQNSPTLFPGRERWPNLGLVCCIHFMLSVLRS